jgi:rubrerythrin
MWHCPQCKATSQDNFSMLHTAKRLCDRCNTPMLYDLDTDQIEMPTTANEIDQGGDEPPDADLHISCHHCGKRFTTIADAIAEAGPHPFCPHHCTPLDVRVRRNLDEPKIDLAAICYAACDPATESTETATADARELLTRLGPWCSAGLDDANVCDELKALFQQVLGLLHIAPTKHRSVREALLAEEDARFVRNCHTASKSVHRRLLEALQTAQWRTDAEGAAQYRELISTYIPLLASPLTSLTDVTPGADAQHAEAVLRGGLVPEPTADEDSDFHATMQALSELPAEEVREVMDHAEVLDLRPDNPDTVDWRCEGCGHQMTAHLQPPAVCPACQGDMGLDLGENEAPDNESTTAVDQVFDILTECDGDAICTTFHFPAGISMRDLCTSQIHLGDLREWLKTEVFTDWADSKALELESLQDIITAMCESWLRQREETSAEPITPPGDS